MSVAVAGCVDDWVWPEWQSVSESRSWSWCLYSDKVSRCSSETSARHWSLSHMHVFPSDSYQYCTVISLKLKCNNSVEGMNNYCVHINKYTRAFI